MITVNNHRVSPTYFPDGCQQVWKLPEEVMDAMVWDVEWVFDAENELVTIMQLSSLAGIREINLTIPYLPYGRQDKKCRNDLTFGLGPFVNFINECVHPSTITLFDPHPANILEILRFNGSFNLSDSAIIMMPNIDFLAETYDLVCFPDKGAKDRYSRFTTKKAIYAEKVRDQTTGEILSLTFKDCDSEIIGKRVLVVDDIFCGGRTFLYLGEQLVNAGVKPDLFISHGVFSSGQPGIYKALQFYSKIITTNSLTCNSSPDPDYRYRHVDVVNWREISVSI